MYGPNKYKEERTQTNDISFHFEKLERDELIEAN